MSTSAFADGGCRMLLLLQHLLLQGYDVVCFSTEAVNMPIVADDAVDRRLRRCGEGGNDGNSSPSSSFTSLNSATSLSLSTTLSDVLSVDNIFFNQYMGLMC